MVLWGQTQSIFQVLFALNVAYYAIDELRRPRIAQTRRQMTDIAKSLAELTVQEVPRRSGESIADYDARNEQIAAKNARFGMQYERCERAVDSYERASVDNVVWFHLASAVISLICLLYGSFQPNVHLSNQVLAWLILVCINPFVFSVGYAMYLRYRFGMSTALAVRELKHNARTALFFLRNPEWSGEAPEADRE
jgi:hypothetical protein